MKKSKRKLMIKTKKSRLASLFRACLSCSLSERSLDTPAHVSATLLISLLKWMINIPIAKFLGSGASESSGARRVDFLLVFFCATLTFDGILTLDGNYLCDGLFFVLFSCFQSRANSMQEINSWAKMINWLPSAAWEFEFFFFTIPAIQFSALAIT